MIKRIRINKPKTINCITCNSVIVTLSNRTLRCKSCASRQYYKEYMLDHKFRIKRLGQMAKSRAKDKNLPFDLTTDYLIGLWEDSNGMCQITGRCIDLSSSDKFGQVNPNAPSIDRIIPSLGYVQGNVRIVTYHVNVALSEFGDKALYELCADILKMNKDTNV